MAPETANRKLAALLSADVYGYSRLMGSNKEDAFKQLTTSPEAVFRQVEVHQGRVANTAREAVLAEFGSVTNTVAAAVDIQKPIAQLKERTPEDRQMWFRIGINLGDVIERGGDLFRDGVNIASRSATDTLC